MSSSIGREGLLSTGANSHEFHEFAQETDQGCRQPYGRDDNGRHNMRYPLCCGLGEGSLERSLTTTSHWPQRKWYAPDELRYTFANACGDGRELTDRRSQ